MKKYVNAKGIQSIFEAWLQKEHPMQSTKIVGGHYEDTATFALWDAFRTGYDSGQRIDHAAIPPHYQRDN
jgi:hypothetical protein